jgi:hypothetical protein
MNNCKAQKTWLISFLDWTRNCVSKTRFGLDWAPLTLLIPQGLSDHHLPI